MILTVNFIPPTLYCDNLKLWEQVCLAGSAGHGTVRIDRETRSRTRVVGTFSDGSSALMLATARLKYVAEHKWGKRRCWTCPN